jgi:SAM-dependent methyltransferase
VLNDQQEHFDRLFRADDDPWGYRSRWYERRRIALLLALLDRSQYGRAFEPGCANGTLTAELAPRCAAIDAWDGSPHAAQLAAVAVADHQHVTVRQALVPDEWPDATFELIVLSDFLYYLRPDDVRSVVTREQGSLAPDGTVLAGHWRGTAGDFRMPGGGAVHAIVGEVLGSPWAAYEDADQVMGCWRMRVPGG